MTGNISAPTAAPLLRVTNVTKRFGGLTAVSGLSFEVYPAEILGLVGPNGAGKSTTFDLISGFQHPTSGTFHFLGRDITGMGAAAVSRLGLVRTFQHASFFPGMTVHDNVLLGVFKTTPGPALRRRKVAAVIELLELGDVADQMAEALPHGRQRMLSIAVALGPSPRLLCLDEPLTGLNLPEVRVALRAIQRVRDEFGTAVMLVEHNMRAVMQLCERIVVVNHGKFLAAGTPAQIRHNPDVISAYLGSDP